MIPRSLRGFNKVGALATGMVLGAMALAFGAGCSPGDGTVAPRLEALGMKQIQPRGKGFRPLLTQARQRVRNSSHVTDQPAAHGASQPSPHGSGSGGAPNEDTLPLKRDGLGSAEELARALGLLRTDEAREALRRGFRLTFTLARQRRDLARAKELFHKVVELEPDSAPAYRGLASLAVQDGFKVAEAIRLYEKAVDLRDDYAEAHYALALLYAMKDKRKGLPHFRKAMELGMKDWEGLARLYVVPKNEPPEEGGSK